MREDFLPGLLIRLFRYIGPMFKTTKPRVEGINYPLPLKQEE
jgi:hypothetical protein